MILTNITIKNLELVNFEYGILYSDVVYGSIQKNKLINNGNGLALHRTENSNITGNIVSNNEWNGFFMQYSQNNYIYNNFFNNDNNVHFDLAGYHNDWSPAYDCNTKNLMGGKCLGGNYWGKPDNTGFSAGVVGNKATPMAKTHARLPAILSCLS